LAHSFKCLGLWLAGSVASGLWWGRISWEKVCSSHSSQETETEGSPGQDIPPRTCPSDLLLSNKPHFWKFPKSSIMTSAIESISGLFYWLGQSPHDPITSEWFKTQAFGESISRPNQNWGPGADPLWIPRDDCTLH
jgi:hypothetical protein